MYCLGCANAARDNTQIVAKILPVFFKSDRAKAAIDCCAFVFSSVISCWLTWYAGDYFLYAIEISRETGYLFLPLVWGESAIFVGMVLITVYTVLQFFKSLALVKNLRTAP
jgi:TRAP-type C4-dicarboxylate transport system, small permease component